MLERFLIGRLPLQKIGNHRGGIAHDPLIVNVLIAIYKLNVAAWHKREIVVRNFLK